VKRHRKALLSGDRRAFFDGLAFYHSHSKIEHQRGIGNYKFEEIWFPEQSPVIVFITNLLVSVVFSSIISLQI